MPNFDPNEYITLSETQQYRKCMGTPLSIIRKMEDFKKYDKPIGYSISAATNLIIKLRKEGYSNDPIILRNEAIRRLKGELVL